MYTQRAGVHPGDGALNPQADRSYPRPLRTPREEEKGGPQGAVSSPVTGNSAPGGPSYNTFGF